VNVWKEGRSEKELGRARNNSDIMLLLHAGHLKGKRGRGVRIELKEGYGGMRCSERGR